MKPALAMAQPFVVWAVCTAFARDWWGLRRWRGHGWVSVALLIAYAAANSVLHPYFDRPELRALGLDSDIDDEFIVAVVVAGAVLIGAAATVRLPFVLFPMLAALLLYRARAGMAAVVVLLCGAGVAVGSHAIFWAMQPRDYPPLHRVGQSVGSVGPIGLAVAGLLAVVVA